MQRKEHRRGQRTAQKLKVRILSARRHSGKAFGMGSKNARQEILWDDEVRGLGWRVYPSGRRTWVVRYKVNGRRRIATLGDYGLFTLKEARESAKAKLVSLKGTGKDPFTQPENVPTAAEFIPVFLADCELRVKPSTLANYKTKAGHISQDLGGLRVTQVEPRDVLRAFARWTAEIGQAGANQTLRLLRALIEFAVKQGLRDAAASNPAEVAQRNPEPKRGRELTAQELKSVSRELAREEQERPEAADTVTAIRLLLFTGARRREITGLTWGEVDLGGRCLRLRDSKTGPRVIQLNTPALTILAALPGGETTERVFPAARHEVSFAVQYTWRRVRERAGCPEARLHDLRHTFVTRGLAANYSELLVGKIVGHRSAATTRRYEHVRGEPVRKAVEGIGASLTADMEDRPLAEVVPLRGESLRRLDVAEANAAGLPLAGPAFLDDGRERGLIGWLELSSETEARILEALFHEHEAQLNILDGIERAHLVSRIVDCLEVYIHDRTRPRPGSRTRPGKSGRPGAHPRELALILEAPLPEDRWVSQQTRAAVWPFRRYAEQVRRRCPMSAPLLIDAIVRAVRPEIVAERVRRGRPRNDAEEILVYGLAKVWESVHQKFPRRQVDVHSGAEKGPFRAFVQACTSALPVEQQPAKSLDWTFRFVSQVAPRS